MGCRVSTQKESLRQKFKKRCLNDVAEIAIYVPSLRRPKNIDFHTPLSSQLSMRLINHLSDLRSRISQMFLQEASAGTKAKHQVSIRNGDLSLADVIHALEEYLPVLLGLFKDGGQIKDKVAFVWVNQLDDIEETTMADAWYEVLSVLHLMSMLSFTKANSLLLTKDVDVYHSKTSEDAQRRSVDILLKAAGYLNYAIEVVIPRIPAKIRSDLPVDLSEEVLRALCLQALGQSVYIQLGMAIDNPRATIAVKRRLACEMVKYWKQANDNIAKAKISKGWGQKHKLFIKWKYAEAKAVAYYYHGIILDTSNKKKSHALAVASLLAAEQFTKECKRARESFHATPPTSRNPSPLSSLKCLSEKIPKNAARLIFNDQDHLFGSNSFVMAAPELPDFVLALAPDDFQPPPLDSIWNE